MKRVSEGAVGCRPGEACQQRQKKAVKQSLMDGENSELKSPEAKRSVEERMRAASWTH